MKKVVRIAVATALVFALWVACQNDPPPPCPGTKVTENGPEFVAGTIGGKIARVEPTGDGCRIHLSTPCRSVLTIRPGTFVKLTGANRQDVPDVAAFLAAHPTVRTVFAAARDGRVDEVLLFDDGDFARAAALPPPEPVQLPEG